LHREMCTAAQVIVHFDKGSDAENRKKIDQF
jgi:hypothetical protein